MKHMICYLLSAVLLLAGSFSLQAEEKTPARKYQTCMSLVESNPAKAIAYADSWAQGNGALAGRHCKALALLASGDATQAATVLESLAADLAAQGEGPQSHLKNSRLKAQIHSQAALAWREAGEIDKAYLAYSAALESFSPDGRSNGRDRLLYELYLERGTLQILRQRYSAAVQDLTAALDLDDRQFEGYLQRAKAYRKKHDFLKAGLDLAVAEKLAGNHPDVLLEQGILCREEGRMAEARESWGKIIDLYPQSDYAELARQNIELLEVK